VKHVLRLEFIGADAAPHIHALRRLFGHGQDAYRELSCRPWVARVLPGDRLEFAHGSADYSDATGSGKRGVWYVYILDSDTIYRVKEYSGWKRSRTYHVRWVNGQREELTREEVLECLRSSDH
jgi:hypothetical protein